MTASFEKIIKSYDIRGVVPEELDAELAGVFGRAFAKFWLEDDPTVSQIVCGRDMRESGVELSGAFMEAVAAEGLDVLDLGVISTDMLYFASGSLNDPGVIFTASHNPAKYNGIKACRRGAVPIGMGTGLERVREIGSEILELPTSGQAAGSVASRGEISQRNMLEEFVAHAQSFVDEENLKPLKVVVDCANGMGGLVAPAVLEQLPFEVSYLYPELDGNFPNHPADPLDVTNLADLQAEVHRLGADAGIAFDGDGDRVFFVDELGVPLSGSVALCIMAEEALRHNPGATILYSAVCSKAVPEIIAEFGGTPVCTRVGHSHIKKQMAETGAAFGGEHSGHFYFAENFKADSGIIAALRLLERISDSGETLSQLRQECERYLSSGEHNMSVKEPALVLQQIKQMYAGFPQDDIDGLSVDLGSWWFNIRPSNTEPLLRVNLETEKSQDCEARLKELCEQIEAV